MMVFSQIKTKENMQRRGYIMFTSQWIRKHRIYLSIIMALTYAQVGYGKLNSTNRKYKLARKTRAECTSFTQEKDITSSSRRSILSISLVILNWFPSQDALAASIMDKYVKRKQLDPLEAYVPAVILTQLQIKDLVKTLEVDQPQYSSCRSVLRSGPAASLRVNIRAVAQYASDSGDGKIASQNVDLCLRALEDLDSLFLHASRNDPGASVKTMKSKIGTALDALDGLLGTVPSDVLEKGKAIADAYYTPDEESIPPQKLDSEMKQLESIL